MKKSLLLTLLLFPLRVLYPVPDGIAGPLIGGVQPDRVTLWMFAPAESACKYTYHSDGPGSPKSGKCLQSPIRPEKARVDPSNQSSKGCHRTRSTISKSPSKERPGLVGSFKTAPVREKPAAFRLALTSCMKIGQPQASWYLLLAQQPDLHLTVGDTHYADTTDPTVQWKHHVTYRRQKEFATVLGKGRPRLRPQ